MKLIFNNKNGKTINAEIVRRSDDQKRRIPRENETVFYSIGDGFDIEAVVNKVQYHYKQKEGSSHVKTKVVVICDVI